jgi:WS/DGAT/MGAT family acyltransferase
VSEELEFEPRMSDADALMWRIEKDPLLRSTITSVVILDQAPDRQRFRRRVERATRVVPRLRQRVLGHAYSIAPPRWEVDPNFDLDYHLRCVRAAGDGSLREVLDMAAPIAMQGFDRARPLWEFYVVEGLEGGRSAIIQKIHHSITDGVGGLKLQLELMDLERDPDGEDELPHAPEPNTPAELNRVVDAVFYETRRQADTARGVASGMAGTARSGLTDPVGVATRGLRLVGSTVRLLQPTTRPLSPLMLDRSLSVHFDVLTFDLAQLKRAAKVVAGRLNDAFVAGVAGGLARYHEQHGTPVEKLRMTMPINVRTESSASTAGNYFVPARFAVPVGLRDPIARMASIRELVESERGEPALALTEPLAQLLNRLPTSASTAVFGSMLKGVDFITSNVPGAPFPVFVGGARTEAQYAFGPMTGAATNVVLLSYCDDVNLGVNVDPAAIPDPDVFVDCLRDSFDEISKLA